MLVRRVCCATFGSLHALAPMEQRREAASIGIEKGPPYWLARAMASLPSDYRRRLR